jgi:hypothetical protein
MPLLIHLTAADVLLLLKLAVENYNQLLLDQGTLGRRSNT